MWLKSCQPAGLPVVAEAMGILGLVPLGAAGQREALEEAHEALGSALPATSWCWAEGGQQGPPSRVGHSQAVLWGRLHALLPLMWGWNSPGGGGVVVQEKVEPKRWISVLREHHELPHCWE